MSNCECRIGKFVGSQTHHLEFVFLLSEYKNKANTKTKNIGILSVKNIVAERVLYESSMDTV